MSELRKHIDQKLVALKKERSNYLEDWRDCSDFVWGSRGRFLSNDKAHKRQRNDKLYNEHAKLAASILASGMMAGITSPARPWFELSTPDPAMMDFGPVKTWLSEVQKIMLQALAKTNFYNSMHSLYLEMGIFGVNPMLMMQDDTKIFRCENYTCGSYMLDINGKREVDTLYREYNLSARQMVDRFGYDNVSRTVQNMYDKGSCDQSIPIIHAIEPRTKRNYESPLAKDMAYMSVYFMKDEGQDVPLMESGFKSRPFIAPRWEAVGEDIYASSYPGLNSMGTNKSLQMEEIDKAVAIEKMHNPPLVGDASLRATGFDLIAGGITFVPNMQATGKPGLSPVYNVNPYIGDLREDIKEKESRIDRHFFADLFMMVTEMDRAQITATEIAERKEEKLLMLGPVLERLNNEGLDPIIDRTYEMLDDAGKIPPPPPELQGADLKVEYVSVLAQAQKAISTAAMEATAAFAGNLATVWPEARHKVDPMQMIDEYARAKGAPPKIIRSDEDANAAAQAEAQAQQAAAMNEQMQIAAQSAKTASETDMANEDSALAAVMGGI